MPHFRPAGSLWTRISAIILALALPMALSAAACRAHRPGAGEAAGAAGAAPAPRAGEYPNLLVERDVPVPMRDGVVLRADLYRPDAPGRFPTLVYRTPYGKDGLMESGGEPTLARLPRAGYAVVVQDVRGRFKSDGVFRPYQQEGKDGYDTIEWAAAQGWSTGRVGTFGLSYPGAVQWLAAMEAPPHLVAIFPAMTFATGRHFFYFGGGFNHDWMRWIALYIAPDERRRRGLPGARTEEQAQREWDQRKWRWEGYLPLRELPVLKDVAPWYYEWLEHPDDGPYWGFADVAAAHGRIRVPAMNFSAWYDSNYGPLGAIANFNGVRAAGATPEARLGQRLVLGPWDHGDPTEHETRVGALDFGPNMTFDYYGFVVRWHDRWLRDVKNGVDEGPPVRLFVMGENRWRDENEWPLQRARSVPYYLRAPGGGPAGAPGHDGAAGTVTGAAGAAGNGRRPGAGRLDVAPPPESEAADVYAYDPRDPVTIENFETAGPFDHAAIQARRDVLSYTSEPLAEPLEVTGPIRVELWVSSSATDTDFAVMLCDVHPDGRAFNLMPMEAGILRARYRNSQAAPEPLVPGQPVRIVIGDMVTSNVFLPGHRIRLQITSSRFPSLDRNPNTGEPFGVSSRTVVARQTILHDAQHASRLILPIVPRGPSAPDPR